MKKGGAGVSNTLTGLHFEGGVDLQKLLENIPGYSLLKVAGKAGISVVFKGKLVARCFKKHEFLEFLDVSHVDWRNLLSGKLLPEDVMLVIVRKTLFVVEAIYQQAAGSVDDELQSCDFRRKQYLKLVAPLGLKVEYVYVLNDWFKKPEYKDVLDYIHSMNCHYKFNELPLAWLGLPAPKN